MEKKTPQQRKMVLDFLKSISYTIPSLDHVCISVFQRGGFYSLSCVFRSSFYKNLQVALSTLLNVLHSISSPWTLTPTAAAQRGCWTTQCAVLMCNIRDATSKVKHAHSLFHPVHGLACPPVLLSSSPPLREWSSFLGLLSVWPSATLPFSSHPSTTS